MKNKKYTMQDRFAEKAQPILQYKNAAALDLVKYPFQPKHLRKFIKDNHITKNDGSEYPPSYAATALSNANIQNTKTTTWSKFVTTRKVKGKRYYYFIDDPELDII